MALDMWFYWNILCYNNLYDCILWSILNGNKFSRAIPIWIENLNSVITVPADVPEPNHYRIRYNSIIVSLSTDKKVNNLFSLIRQHYSQCLMRFCKISQHFQEFIPVVYRSFCTGSGVCFGEMGTPTAGLDCARSSGGLSRRAAGGEELQIACCRTSSRIGGWCNWCGCGYTSWSPGPPTSITSSLVGFTDMGSSSPMTTTSSSSFSRISRISCARRASASSSTWPIWLLLPARCKTVDCRRWRDKNKTM